MLTPSSVRICPSTCALLWWLTSPSRVASMNAPKVWMWSSTRVILLVRSPSPRTTSLSVVSMTGGRSVQVGLVAQASLWIFGAAISLVICLALTRIGSVSSLAVFNFRPTVMVCVGWSGMASTFITNSIVCCFRRRWSGISPQSTCSKAGSSKCSRSDGECLTLDRVKHFLLVRRGTLVSDAAVVEDGADEGTVDHQEGVSRGPPMRARHGTHQVETLPAAIGHVLDVLRSLDMTVEDDSQELDAALVEQARGPQLQRQMGWWSSVAAEFHGDGLGC